MADTEFFNFGNEDELGKQLDPVITRLRERFQPTIDTWLETHDAWMGIRNKSFFKSETFNHHVDYFRRVVERYVVRTAQMVLPSRDFFRIVPTSEGQEALTVRAIEMQHYMLYLLRKRIRTYAVVKQLLRTLGLYGTAIAKTKVCVDAKYVYPSLRAVDPFMFMMWPETVSSVDEAGLLVEDALLPLEQYDAMAKRTGATRFKEAQLTTPRWPTHIITRLSAAQKVSEPSELPRPEAGSTKKFGEDGSVWVFMSEVWVSFGDHWRRCWVVWNKKQENANKQDIHCVVVKIFTQKYERPSYRLTRSREVPGEQQTTSMGDDERNLQILLNDNVNMTLEGQAMAMAPPIGVNTEGGSTRVGNLKYAPRRVWPMAGPGGITVVPIPDTSKAGYQGIQSTIGMMNEFAASNPLAEGQPVRNLPRAGFAVSSLMSMSLADMRDYARTLEDDIMTPILEDLYKLAVEFVPEDQRISLPRTRDFKGGVYTIGDLQGDFDFSWVGSIQAEADEERAKKMIGLSSGLSKVGPVMVQDLAQRGYRINWLVFLKTLWDDTILGRGVDSIIEKIPQDQQAPQQEAPAVGEDQMGQLAQLLNSGGGNSGGY